MYVCLLGGFLGSGKTTLLLEIAKAVANNNQKVAIIVNESGDVGIDGTKIQKEGYEAIELSEGCICCSLSGTLQNTLIKINNDFQPDVIILEPTGLALPHRVEQIIRTSMIHPEKVITIGIVDAFRFGELIHKRKEFLTRQLMSSSFIAVNKCDLVDEKTLEKVMEVLVDICPGRELIPTSVTTGIGVKEITGRLVL